MASFLDPIQSSALVVYTPQVHPLVKAKADMSEIQDLFMKKSFQAQVADYRNFRRSWSGRVVVLVGGSSAGKSTIVQALKNFDRGMLEEGPDLTGAHFIYEFMEKNYTLFGVSDKEWEHLHSILAPRKDHWNIHEAVSQEMGTLCLFCKLN